MTGNGPAGTTWRSLRDKIRVGKYVWTTSWSHKFHYTEPWKSSKHGKFKENSNKFALINTSQQRYEIINLLCLIFILRNFRLSEQHIWYFFVTAVNIKALYTQYVGLKILIDNRNPTLNLWWLPHTSLIPNHRQDRTVDTNDEDVN